MFEVWWKITEEMNMKKLLTIFLLSFSINGYCEWVKVTSGTTGTQYIDFSTIKRNGKYLRVWDLIDFNNKTSQISLTQFDCDEERTMLISLTGYSGSMGTGTPSSTPINPKWEYEIPNTNGYILLKRVCKK